MRQRQCATEAPAWRIREAARCEGAQEAVVNGDGGWGMGPPPLSPPWDSNALTPQAQARTDSTNSVCPPRPCDLRCRYRDPYRTARTTAMQSTVHTSIMETANRYLYTIKVHQCFISPSRLYFLLLSETRGCLKSFGIASVCCCHSGNTANTTVQYGVSEPRGLGR